LAAFEGLHWGRHVWPVLEESLKWAVAIPQVPGGYITGRSLHNAFIATVVDSENPTHALFVARDEINRELAAKRAEFGIEN
jgi:hypothetical protein